ncbi:MAG: hypothetical protein EAZ78_03025 [Oscillatoriales cyanobacterium]|uniref:Uncharacterized protein n=1 Tax=Microcoleus anatoxicus PTRS2 TaxID=2705321 RepID=A0ABU8YFT0_9CYAN|nr:MAG: hypothetical protein EA000_17300 [Oscillatoriales cyanobacterium]TAD97644.1 MAG: hypothetical protein EAZ98_09005 [Oscillatoriales cyanobacterium]TAE05488.1 MAG: hypothetical protein EAZ96_05265 [Oscillatoriales cyanobacterium]TAF06309.1 MAG: hypothetical protein EAZ78_03025 [Oscillatoriales cyanobacterium]TAF35110.1 MAG: hypothetical protein EAZ68_18555 [Oscillatoriales cyanobacterium]
MPSENPDLPKTQTLQGQNCLIPSDLVLSLVTLPLLGGLLVAKTTAEFVSSLGVESEEVFRGSRLPQLNFPYAKE